MTDKRKDPPRQQARLEFDPPLRTPSPDASALPEPATSRPGDLLGELPLFPQKVGVAAEPTERRSPDAPAETPAETPTETLGGGEDRFAEGRLEDELPEPAEEVSLGARYLAGLADLAIQGSVLILALVGQSLLGPLPRTEDWPAYLVFLLAFSFLYTVVPLAFWGQTPGMSVVGLVVRSENGENLTVPETARRWLVGVFSSALLGLPLLIALSGRSLGDRLSRSFTYRL